jgi:hypothetical protein
MFVGYAEFSKAWRVLTWFLAGNADCTQLEVHAQSEFFEASLIPSEGHNSEVHASDDPQSISSSSSIHNEIEPNHEFDPADVGVDIPGQPRYPGRERKAPDRLTFNVTASTPDAPFDRHKGSSDNPTLKEALQRQDKELWVQAINDELRSVFEKQVYEESELPPGRKALTMRMVLKIKRDIYGNVEKYKARLVVRGFVQKEGIDFEEILLPQLNVHLSGCSFPLLLNKDYTLSKSMSLQLS